MEITPEMIEAGAMAIRRVMVRGAVVDDGDFVVVDWPQLPERARDKYREMAKSALDAALLKQGANTTAP